MSQKLGSQEVVFGFLTVMLVKCSRPFKPSERVCVYASERGGKEETKTEAVTPDTRDETSLSTSLRTHSASTPLVFLCAP